MTSQTTTQPPRPGSVPSPSDALAPTPLRDSEFILEPRKPKATLLHLGVLAAAVILPITLTPYLLLRRRLHHLRTLLIEVRSANIELGRRVRQLDLENAAHADSLGRMTAAVREVERKVAVVSMEGKGRDVETRNSVGALKGEMERLGRLNRDHSASLGALGTSLADVAGFMYEVNIRHGTSNELADKKVENLRSVELMMVHDHRERKLDFKEEKEKQ